MGRVRNSCTPAVWRDYLWRKIVTKFNNGEHITAALYPSGELRQEMQADDDDIDVQIKPDPVYTNRAILEIIVPSLGIECYDGGNDIAKYNVEYLDHDTVSSFIKFIYTGKTKQEIKLRKFYHQSNECNKIDLLLSPIVNDLREGVATNNVLMWIDSLFKKLNRYRLNNQTPLKNEETLLDAALVCDDGTQLPCHSFLLSCASPIFAESLRVSNTAYSCINVELASKYLLEILVNFLYSGNVVISNEKGPKEENMIDDGINILFELMEIGRQLEIGRLVQSCKNILDKMKYDRKNKAIIDEYSDDEPLMAKRGIDDFNDDSMSTSMADDEALLDSINNEEAGNSSITNEDQIPIADHVMMIKKEIITQEDIPELPFKCDEFDCTRSFNTLQGLQVHLRKHQIIRKTDCMHVCPIAGCDRMFSMTSSLRRHISCIHDKESSKDKPFLPTMKSDVKQTAPRPPVKERETPEMAPNDDVSHSVGLALQTINDQEFMLTTDDPPQQHEVEQQQLQQQPQQQQPQQQDDQMTDMRSIASTITSAVKDVQIVHEQQLRQQFQQRRQLQLQQQQQLNQIAVDDDEAIETDGLVNTVVTAETSATQSAADVAMAATIGEIVGDVRSNIGVASGANVVVGDQNHGIELLDDEAAAAEAAREIVATARYDEAKLAGYIPPDLETIETGVMRSESVHENLMKRYRCRTCDVTFANVANLMKHREEFHPDQTIKPPTGINQYACKFCDKVYRFALGLQKHVLTEHPSPSDNVTVLTCDQCPRKFLSSVKLENHVNLIHSTGPKPEGCKFCSRRFATRSHAAAHERTHTGARPYACYVCKRSFTQKSVLTAHMLIHTGVRRFVCKFCGRAFSRSHHLDSHYRTHTGERNHKCDICLKMYTSPDVLRQHQRVHTGERPFTCATCGSKFKMSAHLAVHQLTHNGIKKYCCSVCGKRFARLHHLERHHMTHTGEKPFTCEICGRSYNQTASLKYHRRTAHPDQVSAAEVAVKPRSRDYLPSTAPMAIELKQNGTVIEVLTAADQLDLDRELTESLLNDVTNVQMSVEDGRIHVQEMHDHSISMQTLVSHHQQQQHQQLHQQHQYITHDQDHVVDHMEQLHHQQQQHILLQQQLSEDVQAAGHIIIDQSGLGGGVVINNGQPVDIEHQQMVIDGGVEQSIMSSY